MTASDIHHQASISGSELLVVDDGLAATLPQALQAKLEDWLALELTAERMAKEELALVSDYVSEDIRQWLNDFKIGLLGWEKVALDYLLNSADPVQREWLASHWVVKNGE